MLCVNNYVNLAEIKIISARLYLNIILGYNSANIDRREVILQGLIILGSVVGL
jgi:hypothetical protein